MTSRGRLVMGLSMLTLLCSTVDSAVPWRWNLPAHVPAPRVPADNPMSDSVVELGRHLFYDVRLSGNGTLACAGCHVQERAFTDGRRVAEGSTGEATHRNAPGLANSAWHATYNWSHPAVISLERQMETPLFGDAPVEMGINDANRPLILARLRAEPRYRNLFRDAFPDDSDSINFANVIRAIAAFERSILSFDSRYDRYVLGTMTFSEAEQRGHDLFFGEKAECHHCHGSFNFNDQVVHARSRIVEMPFHNTGIYNIDGRGGYPYPSRGVFESTGRAEDMGAFRAPSLRNVAVTAPYMHDGSLATLREVIEQYARGGRLTTEGPNRGDGRLNPFKSGLISKIELTPQDIDDLEAFLQTLTDAELLSSDRYADPWLNSR